ncbi:hypothetical protein PO909_022751 [Leuciscus waleckii]
MRWANNTHTCRALVDSGAEGNFMDINLAYQLHLPISPLPHQISVNALNGQQLPNFTHSTDPITLITSGNHTETIPFLLMDSPVAPVVLGHPWLVKHNPRVDWGSNSVSMWSEPCHESCLVSACPSVSVSVLQKKPADLSNVPAEYLDLKEVFSKSRAASLPPHRPYDCAIDLVLGYIVSSEGMRMDPDKVKAVIDWPSPDSRKALQWFLGFANFYRRFIRNFSQLAAPLTALTSPRTTFRWSDTAEAVFTNLKSRFVSAPILVAPDPTRQFVVEVDASEVGVGAVLSQRASSDDKMYPCPFFSHRLSPAERNYDIGNRELLAVKLALEEWRHWLEGSGVPFIVWTDHKNLEYIRSAKRLNSRQARWALFFGRFDFTLSYRPGSKNIKPDSLSRIFDPSERPVTPECILPEKVVISTLIWEVESKVKTALEGVTPPPACPPNRLFVPEELRSDVIRWGHCSNVACHPGVSRTSHLVKQRFWWPLMARDIHDFVLACSDCAMGKTSNRPPDGLLRPLSVPSRPWSHIALDFVTALPPSRGMTVVLTVVDRFSKAAHFIPLPKLPSAKETAVTVIDHVFWLHGFPMDVVSDRGSQFVSKFWQEFCRLLGATVSLSSGYHPQSDGQSERANQDLERMLRCLEAKNPSSWSQQLSMVEYAHNSLPVSATGLSPKCSLGYQPPIFPSLESEVAVPSAHAFVQRCRRTWTRARETLLQVGSRTKAKADRHRSRPPVYVVGQKVSLFDASCSRARSLFLVFRVHRILDYITTDLTTHQPSSALFTARLSPCVTSPAVCVPVCPRDAGSLSELTISTSVVFLVFPT